MTLLTEIQAAQSLLLRPFISKLLLLRTPLEVIELFNPNHYDLWIFDSANYGDSSDYVYLRLWAKYESDDKPLGDRSYRPTFNGVSTSVATRQPSFTATVSQSQAFIFQIVQRLALIADTSSYSTHAPIKLIDFCRPEAVDDSNTFEYDDGVGTIRYGRIDIEKPPQIIKGWRIDYCMEGWNFKFTEANLKN